MASYTTIPTEDEILASLGQDPRFPLNSKEFNTVRPLVLLLPEVIGEERLGQRVTIGEFCQVQADFLSRILETDFDKDVMDLGLQRTLFRQLISQLTEVANNIDTVLRDLGQTEEQVILSEQTGLNEPLKELYLAGRLTFAEMVRQQPGIFIPR